MRRCCRGRSRERPETPPRLARACPVDNSIAPRLVCASGLAGSAATSRSNCAAASPRRPARAKATPRLFRASRWVGLRASARRYRSSPRPYDRCDRAPAPGRTGYRHRPDWRVPGAAPVRLRRSAASRTGTGRCRRRRADLGHTLLEAAQERQRLVEAAEHSQERRQLLQRVGVIRIEFQGAANQELPPGAVGPGVGRGGLLEEKRRAARFAREQHEGRDRRTGRIPASGRSVATPARHPRDARAPCTPSPRSRMPGPKPGPSRSLLREPGVPARHPRRRAPLARCPAPRTPEMGAAALRTGAPAHGSAGAGSGKLRARSQAATAASRRPSLNSASPSRHQAGRSLVRGRRCAGARTATAAGSPRASCTSAR